MASFLDCSFYSNMYYLYRYEKVSTNIFTNKWLKAIPFDGKIIWREIGGKNNALFHWTLIYNKKESIIFYRCFGRMDTNIQRNQVLKVIQNLLKHHFKHCYKKSSSKSASVAFEKSVKCNVFFVEMFLIKNKTK